jgi:hypothetical protein
MVEDAIGQVFKQGGDQQGKGYNRDEPQNDGARPLMVRDSGDLMGGGSISIKDRRANQDIGASITGMWFRPAKPKLIRNTIYRVKICLYLLNRVYRYRMS